MVLLFLDIFSPECADFLFTWHILLTVFSASELYLPFEVTLHEIIPEQFTGTLKFLKTNFSLSFYIFIVIFRKFSQYLIYKLIIKLSDHLSS